MSFSIAIDGPKNDFSIKNGRLLLALGEDAIRNRIQVILQRILGEWYLDSTDGIPLYTEFLGEKNINDEVQFTLRRQVLDDPNVTRINTLTVFRDTRKERQYRIQMSVNITTDNGSTTLTVEV